MSSPVKPADIKAVVSNPTSAMCGNFIATLLKFPPLVYQFFLWAIDSSGNLTNAFKQQIVPAGDLIFSAAPLAENAYRLLCDGREVAQATYPDLYAAIGDTYAYGGPVGTGNFKLPDFRAYAPAGVGNLPITGTPTSLGQRYGKENVILDGANVPAHNHRIFAGGSDGSSGAGHRECIQTVDDGHSGVTATYLLTNDVVAGKPDYIEKTGGDNLGAAVAHENLGPRMGCYIYIKT